MTNWWPEPVAVDGSGLLGEARGGQLVQDARREHEEHVARVLDRPRVVECEITAHQVVDPLEFGPGVRYVGRQRGQHHSEAADVLVVEALEAALVVLHAGHVAAFGSGPHACDTCGVLGKIHLALKALGK